MKDAIVFGAGGHAKVVVDALTLDGWKVKALVANQEGEGYAGVPVVLESELSSGIRDLNCLYGIVALGDNLLRRRVVEKILQQVPEFNFITAVHPSAVLAGDVTIGAGSMVLAGVVVNSQTVVGDHCILNTSCSVDHDCHLESFCSVAPGAHLGGTVSVGASSAIGLGASVINNISIGKNTVIGAGAVVVRDVPDEVVSYGTPAKTVRINRLK